MPLGINNPDNRSFVIPYNIWDNKLILGVASIKFDSNGHVNLNTKREFTNKNTESTSPEITNAKREDFCTEPITLQIGGHYIWFLYRTPLVYDKIPKVDFIIIDANDIIKFAP